LLSLPCMPARSTASSNAELVWVYVQGISVQWQGNSEAPYLHFRFPGCSSNVLSCGHYHCLPVACNFLCFMLLRVLLRYLLLTCLQQQGGGLVSLLASPLFVHVQIQPACMRCHIHWMHHVYVECDV
jgi:hypothetical protein